MTRRPRGFALVIVLWAAVALATGGAILTATARRALGEADAAGRAATASAALDSAGQQAIFHLLAAGQAGWPPTGTRTLRVGDLVVAIRIDDQAGTINPNTASPALLAALLVALGQSEARATALADDIVEWRAEARIVRQSTDLIPAGAAARYAAAGLRYAPPGAPFQTIGELGLVLGMTPALLARLRPYLSLWWDGDPNPALAAPPVREALRALARGTQLQGDPFLGSIGTGIRVLAITARIQGGPGRGARRIVVQLLPTAPRPVHIVESTDLPDA